MSTEANTTEEEVRMPQGARDTECDECGFTYGTHSDDCSQHPDYEPPEPDGEDFRGDEAAAYEAEEMARIQRTLK